MCKFKTLGVSWPPQGWKEFDLVDQSYGQAILKNPISAIVTGLSYSIEPVPVFDQNDRRHYVYSVSISGWDYNIYNESNEYPILSFILKDKLKIDGMKASYLSDLKTQGRSLPMTERSGHRVFMAALFVMKQIEKGQVPDFERVLRLYKVHPTQRSLYVENDYIPNHSLFCGLKFSVSDNICVHDA